MTAQINDSVFHRKITFEIAASKGSGLFNPDDFGLKTQAVSSACWRGYVAEYEICDAVLCIRRLRISLAPAHPVPELYGKRPIRKMGELTYNELAQKICFNGGLLLATGFVRELYVHMGFHPAWKYEHVRELIFKDGDLVYEEDKSEEVAAIRRRRASDPLGPGSEKPADVMEWIDDCFTQHYKPGSI